MLDERLCACGCGLTFAPKSKINLFASKACQNRKWQSDNRDRVNARVREWYAANTEKAKGSCRAWKAANPEKANASTRKYYQKNADGLNAKRSARRRAGDVAKAREIEREAVKQWRADNPERSAAVNQRVKETEPKRMQN